MTPGEIEKMLNDLAEQRERNAFQLGDGIRRTAIRGGLGAIQPDDRQWYTDVWDDEYYTTIILIDEDTPVENIKGIFLQLKEANWKKES